MCLSPVTSCLELSCFDYRVNDQQPGQGLAELGSESKQLVVADFANESRGMGCTCHSSEGLPGPPLEETLPDDI